jgi:HEAT repeat protein
MSGLPLRVMVQDAWDEVAFDLPPTTSLADVKRRALQAAQVRGDPNAYLLKFRGAELRDESRSLAEAGLVPNAALIVLSRRRRPVR